MIKIGVFGISGETIGLTDRIRKEKETVITGYHLSSPADAPEGGVSFLTTDPEELLMASDALIFSDPLPGDMLILRAAIRMYRSLFFLRTDHLREEELREIRELVGEAGVQVHCYNPLRDHPLFPEALARAGHLLFAEIILHVQGSGKEKRLTDPLIFSFEAALHTNRTQPRRPATGGYLMPGAAAGMIHIQMEFDDGMICLIRHELSDKGPSARCRFSGGKATATADLEKGTLRVRTQESEDHIPAEKLFPGHTFSPLYHSWQRFLRQPAEPLPALEERITATRLAKYTTEKIHNRILTPAAPEKTW
jgi:hypothetical protein